MGPASRNALKSASDVGLANDGLGIQLPVTGVDHTAITGFDQQANGFLEWSGRPARL
jgi:hypothetical protein